MRTAVITGIGRGIGLATARRFLDGGWGVVGTFHTEPAALTHAALTQVRLDLASPESIARAAADIAATAPRVDALVNSAAVLLDYSDTAADAGRVRATLEVNVVGTVDFTERILPLMDAGGHIVNVDSNMGSFARPIDEDGAPGYRMSKAALNMYTRYLAFVLRERGILVSSLDPGWVDTDMGRAGGDVPDRRPEEPAEELFRLVTDVVDIGESGNFWHKNEKRPW